MHTQWNVKCIGSGSIPHKGKTMMQSMYTSETEIQFNGPKYYATLIIVSCAFKMGFGFTS